MLRALPNGTLDATFGTGGAVVTPLPEQPSHQVVALAIQPGGKLLVASSIPVFQSSSNGRYVIARYEADGTLRVHLPWFRRGVLETTVTGRTGSTPFMRFGSTPTVVVATLLAVLALAMGRGKKAAMGDRR